MKPISNAARRVAATAAQQAAGTTSGQGSATIAGAELAGIPGGRASSSNSMVPRRPISTVVNPTVTDAKGRVADPGHVQLQTTPEEQAEYGVGPVLGHSPQSGLPSSARKIEPETGTFPDGRPFDVKAIRLPAAAAGSDKFIPNPVMRYDHGHMTPEQSERFKAFESQPVSPEYQTMRDNCVTGYDKMFSTILDREPHDPPPGTRPQDIAEANRDVRTDDSDLG